MVLRRLAGVVDFSLNLDVNAVRKNLRFGCRRSKGKRMDAEVGETDDDA